MASTRVLFVDDDRNILAAFRRQLRGIVDIETAAGGREGLSMMKEHGPFGAVVVDMQMPEMNGIELLQQYRKIAPDVVRIMLTGNADQETAVRALNDGQIFRFLNKPCSTEDIVSVTKQALEQHRLLTAEKELLQKTLAGSVKVLTDILALVDPGSFGDVVGLREPIRKIARGLGIENCWDIELAAMLSTIGSVLLPPVLSVKIKSGMKLTPNEQAVVEAVPESSRKLISNLPRLEGVADIVYYWHKNFDGSGYPVDPIKGEKLPIGARIVRVLKDLKSHEARGMSIPEALAKLRAAPGIYDPKVLEAAVESLMPQATAKVSDRPAAPDSFEITIKELCPGQTLLADVETTDGVLLIGKGSILSESHVQRIRNYASLVGIKEPMLVNALIPPVEPE